MPVDPNLTADTCIFMQPGASPYWWTSDDVMITGPSATGVAQPGVINSVQVTVRQKPQGCTLPSQTDFVKVDLYVCNPTASPPVITSGQVKKILDANPMNPTFPDITVDLANLPNGGSFPQTVQWDLPPISGSSHPAETAGHKCLIARAYPNTLTGGINIGDYVQSGDQHYAQRNICIQTCSSPCGVDLWTENDNRELRQDVTFRVIADLNPTQQVLDITLPLLRQVPGFRRVVSRTPRNGFGLRFPDFPNAEVTDNTRPGCLGLVRKLFSPSGAGFQPSFAARVQLAPRQLTTYRFMTDLDGSEVGDAHLFHLMHVENNRVLSGITIAMVKV
jgi:hypothetical protein